MSEPAKSELAKAEVTPELMCIYVCVCFLHIYLFFFFAYLCVYFSSQTLRDARQDLKDARREGRLGEELSDQAKESSGRLQVCRRRRRRRLCCWCYLPQRSTAVAHVYHHAQVPPYSLPTYVYHSAAHSAVLQQ